MRYFGTDGIRGEAYTKLTLELAYKVGRSLSLLNIDELVVGYDTRESSVDLANKLIEGAISVGLNVINFNVLPTPALILESYYRKSIGVMITASHNPYKDNGIKIIKMGYKIDDIDKTMIEDYIDGILTIRHKINGTVMNMESSYLDYLSKYIIRTNLKIVIDCANGATSSFSSIFDKMAKVKYISNNPNGKNINENCGATHPLNLINNMDNYDLGIAFDGDGDRIIVVDNNKNVVDGDKLIYLFTNFFKKHDWLKKDTVVLTVMSNLGIINALNDLNINTTLTKVGDQNVLDCMIKNGYNLGGENSGHIISPFSITGDGILNAMILLTILSEENKSLYELTKDIEMYPYKLINLKVSDKSIIENETIKTKVKEYENKFDKYGKIILRASGTEDLIRVTVMHKDESIMNECINTLVSLINEGVK